MLKMSLESIPLCRVSTGYMREGDSADSVYPARNFSPCGAFPLASLERSSPSKEYIA